MTEFIDDDEAPFDEAADNAEAFEMLITRIFPNHVGEPKDKWPRTMTMRDAAWRVINQLDNAVRERDRAMERHRQTHLELEALRHARAGD